MLCGSCGLKVHDNARYCKNCGAEVNAARKTVLQDGSLTSLISKNLQPAVQPIPKRSEQHSHSQPQPARRFAPDPDPVPQSNQWESGQIPESADLDREETPPVFQKKYRSSATIASVAGDMILAEGEIALRTYLCLERIAPWYSSQKDNFKGYLTVTNRRIIYRSLGENVHSVREIPIESYRGFECCYGRGWSFSELLSGIIVSFGAVGLLFLNLLTAVPLGVFRISTAAPFGILIVGLVLILISHHKTMALRIYSERQNVSPISLVRHSKGLGRYDAGLPAEQTDVMMSEVGALISDVQRFGDEAATKWAG
ncbi:MAG: hypothetical protein LBI74_02695 [Synergistaceae bacterium]|jgi:hypothetical protein|nr:hypothetical protein [Synergistaceae bacterium]